MFLLRVGLLLPALTLGTTHASGASGRRCCEEGKGCAGGGIVDVFEPPVSPSLDVSWSFHPLQCPEGYRKHQVDIEEDSLVPRQASLELRWMDVFWRRTTEFCVAVNFTGKYIAFLCRPDVQKVNTHTHTQAQEILHVLCSIPNGRWKRQACAIPEARSWAPGVKPNLVFGKIFVIL